MIRGNSGEGMTGGDTCDSGRSCDDDATSGKPLVYFFMLFMLFCAFISEKSKFSEKAFCF